MAYQLLPAGHNSVAWCHMCMMVKALTTRGCWGLIIFVLALPARADAVEPLPFGDGSLLALGIGCMMAIAWMMRRNRK